ncbi:MAG: GyrI-like domain-containing protein [Cyclobacteriaceae bacterium]
METILKEGFKVIGIKVRTSNENEQAASDIPALWGRFMSENIAAKIPNKKGDEVYSIYTNYESDYTKPYDAVLACRVDSLEEIPDGMVGIEIKESKYRKFTAKGNLADGIVYNQWLEIWNTDLDRKYTADFEVFGASAQDQTNAIVDIFVAVN